MGGIITFYRYPLPSEVSSSSALQCGDYVLTRTAQIRQLIRQLVQQDMHTTTLLPNTSITPYIEYLSKREGVSIHNYTATDQGPFVQPVSRPMQVLQESNTDADAARRCARMVSQTTTQNAAQCNTRSIKSYQESFLQIVKSFLST